MTTTRLSRLQRRILAWLAQEEQRTRGTMAASHQELNRTTQHWYTQIAEGPICLVVGRASLYQSRVD
jgi:hypothetical protein